MEFEEFAATRLTELLHFTRALTGDRGTAEDIVQDVALKLHQRQTELDRIADLDAYARRMAVNAYLSWGRKWFRVRPTEAVIEDRVEPDLAVRVVEQDALATRLSRLPKRQRAVLVLRYYAGATDAQIAAELRCSVSTVRSHASRALSTLRLEATTDSTEHQAREPTR